MKQDEVNAKVSEAQRSVAAAQLQLDGVRKFYDAALMMRNQAGADLYRSQMHALLDVVLDNTAIIYSIIQSNAKL